MLNYMLGERRNEKQINNSRVFIGQCTGQYLLPLSGTQLTIFGEPEVDRRYNGKSTPSSISAENHSGNGQQVHLKDYFKKLNHEDYYLKDGENPTLEEVLDFLGEE